MLTQPHSFDAADAEDDVRIVPAAPVVRRLLAFLIDGLVLVLPASLFVPSIQDILLNDGLAELLGFGFRAPLVLFPGALLLALLEALTGRTVGKLLLGLRVVDIETGESIGPLRAVGRRAILVFEGSVMFIPSIVLLLFSRPFDGHLGDRLVGAVVAGDEDGEGSVTADA